jgi:hypothetical protein
MDVISNVSCTPLDFSSLQQSQMTKDGNFTRGCGYSRVPNPTGKDTGRKLHP